MATGFPKMFGSPGSGFGGGGFSTPSQQQNQQQSMTAIGSLLVSPNSSGFGTSSAPTGTGGGSGGGGSPIFQSPMGNKFPPGGGPVVFSPYTNPSPVGVSPLTAAANVASPYSFVGGSASSFVQSPPPMYGGSAGGYPPPQLSSTLASASPPHHIGHPTSPVTHGYGQPIQYTNVQPYGYGARAMSGSYAYHISPYQHNQMMQYQAYSHHSPREREETTEPMHCSPVGQAHAQMQPHFITNSPQFQQQQQLQQHNQPFLQRSPPRIPYAPAYFTGVDVVAAVPPRPRRVFDRSPSTSPPTAGSGGRSPQTKPPIWGQAEGIQQPAASGSYGGQDGATPNIGGLAKRTLGQGPNRQLRFNDTQTQQNTQNTQEKGKTKKCGPPTSGFGSNEELENFLNSPLLKQDSEIVPGAVIAQEAVAKIGANIPVAESNWITVFGFPAAAASFIYTHFSQYGSIIQSKSNPGGNWLHIHYTNRIDARRALACNGKVLGGTIMVGVISSPKEVIEMYDKTRAVETLNPNPVSVDKPTQAKSPLQERNSSASNRTEGSHQQGRGIRSLTGSSQMTSPVVGGEKSGMGQPFPNKSLSLPPNIENQSENVPLPTASTGILTKAMEYMFGW